VGKKLNTMRRTQAQAISKQGGHTSSCGLGRRKVGGGCQIITREDHGRRKAAGNGGKEGGNKEYENLKLEKRQE